MKNQKNKGVILPIIILIIVIMIIGGGVYFYSMREVEKEVEEVSIEEEPGKEVEKEVEEQTKKQLPENIGKEYGGGYVFYQDNEITLIAAEVDYTTPRAWSNLTTTEIGEAAQGTALGTGQSNTTAIISQAGHTASAAKICDDLDHNGYTDWFLPSKDELNHIYCNLHKGSGASPFLGDCSGTDDLQLEIGSFADSDYWSSSEGSSYYALFQDFDDGDQHNFSKDITLRVRCARAI